MVSVIIPLYNEESTIVQCLLTLDKQNYRPVEILLVDDGSTDSTVRKIQQLIRSHGWKSVKLFRQEHKGTAAARNFAAEKADGDILVFADADMTFDSRFIGKLIDPIQKRKTIGTYTREEYVSNWDNVWARCWNFNEHISDHRRIPENAPEQSPVYRAILKTEFDRIGGFDEIGFTDDWTLSRKLGRKATPALGAICYHHNPASLTEVYIQARWIGKNEFISGSLSRRIFSLIRYNFLFQVIRGIFISWQYREIRFLVFQAVYFWAIWLSVWKSFAGEGKYK